MNPPRCKPRGIPYQGIRSFASKVEIQLPVVILLRTLILHIPAACRTAADRQADGQGAGSTAGGREERIAGRVERK
jgi:hypothetical protein